MRKKVVKMGLAIVMSVALLAGCGGGSNAADGYKNDVKAFAALSSVDNTDFDAMAKAVEDLDVSTDEGKAIKTDMQELIDISLDAQNNAASMDADALVKLQEDMQSLTEKVQTDLESFVKAATDAGLDEEDVNNLATDIGM